VRHSRSLQHGLVSLLDHAQLPKHERENLNLYIFACIDRRVEPAQVRGVRLGEALMQRDIGGRITPAIIRDIAYAGRLVDTGPRKAGTSRSRSSTRPT
jgi:carbonic anhydrase